MLAPIALFLSQQMGVSPYPMMMALAATCAAGFATPVATPPNTLVLTAGYRFTDYLVVGGLLTAISYDVVILLVPLIWPFQPLPPSYGIIGEPRRRSCANS
jgi:di/tricarboxylate transporter